MAKEIEIPNPATVRGAALWALILTGAALGITLILNALSLAFPPVAGIWRAGGTGSNRLDRTLARGQ